MKKTLLEKAKSLETQKKSSRSFTDEEYELILALVNNEVSLSQVKRATGIKSVTTVYVYAFRCLQDYMNKKNKKLK